MAEIRGYNSQKGCISGGQQLPNNYIQEEIEKIFEELKILNRIKADKSEIPDVSEFITKDVNNLVNYYTKSQTYTKTEVDNLITSNDKLFIVHFTSSSFDEVDKSPSEMFSAMRSGLIPILIGYVEGTGEYNVVPINVVTSTYAQAMLVFETRVITAYIETDKSVELNQYELLDSSKVKNSLDTTAGNVYDVRYINTMIGDIETILTTLTTGSGV